MASTSDLNDLAANAAIEIASIELAHRQPAAAAAWLDRAKPAVEQRWRDRWLVERIDAAVGCRDGSTASSCLYQLERSAGSQCDAWTSGGVARSHARIATAPDAAHGWAMLAVKHFETANAVTDSGRALLVAAEALAGKPVVAREHLVEARLRFRHAGAVAWEQRARRGLMPTPMVLEGLTRAEQRVVDAVIDGAPNRDVAAQLHLSTSTVSWHLQSVFRKLGIHSRAELVRIAS